MLPRAPKSSAKPFGIVLTNNFLEVIVYVYLLFLSDFSNNLDLK
jgi:hypothetical protein